MIELARKEGKLGLKNPPEMNLDFFCFDFAKLASRWSHGPPKKSEPMAKALRPNSLEGILDVGSGTGQDALYMASLGLRVLSFEKDFIVYLLLCDAHKRLLQHNDSDVVRLAENLSFHFGDVRDLKWETLKGWGVYHDPMYMSSGAKGDRKRHHHALPRKEMQFLRSRESSLASGPAANRGEEIFRWSSVRECSRMILKRPVKAPDLLANLKKEPFRREAIFKGKSTRYEVYKSNVF